MAAWATLARPSGFTVQWHASGIKSRVSYLELNRHCANRRSSFIAQRAGLELANGTPESPEIANLDLWLQNGKPTFLSSGGK